MPTMNDYTPEWMTEPGWQRQCALSRVSKLPFCACEESHCGGGCECTCPECHGLVTQPFLDIEEESGLQPEPEPELALEKLSKSQRKRRNRNARRGAAAAAAGRSRTVDFHNRPEGKRYFASAAAERAQEATEAKQRWEKARTRDLFDILGEAVVDNVVNHVVHRRLFQRDFHTFAEFHDLTFAELETVHWNSGPARQCSATLMSMRGTRTMHDDLPRLIPLYAPAWIDPSLHHLAYLPECKDQMLDVMFSRAEIDLAKIVAARFDLLPLFALDAVRQLSSPPSAAQVRSWHGRATDSSDSSWSCYLPPSTRFLRHQAHEVAGHLLSAHAFPRFALSDLSLTPGHTFRPTQGDGMPRLILGPFVELGSQTHHRTEQLLSAAELDNAMSQLSHLLDLCDDIPGPCSGGSPTTPPQFTPLLTLFASSGHQNSHFLLTVFGFFSEPESSDSSAGGAEFCGAGDLPDRMFLCANMDSAVRWLSSLNAITADIPETCSGGSTMAPTPPTLTFYASSGLSHFLFHLRILSESESSDSSATDGAGAVSEDCGGIVPRLTRWLSSTIIGGDGPWLSQTRGAASG